MWEPYAGWPVFLAFLAGILAAYALGRIHGRLSLEVGRKTTYCPRCCGAEMRTLAVKPGSPINGGSTDRLFLQCVWPDCGFLTEARPEPVSTALCYTCRQPTHYGKPCPLETGRDELHRGGHS